jgi:hypothetical protein
MILVWFRDRKLRKAAKLLSDARIRRERAEIKRVAQQMRRECGLPPSAALR